MTNKEAKNLIARAKSLASKIDGSYDPAVLDLALAVEYICAVLEDNLGKKPKKGAKNHEIHRF